MLRVRDRDLSSAELQARVGFGRATFDVVSRLVMSWEMHRRSRLDVRPSEPSAAEGAVAVLRLGVGVLGVTAPVRVVREINEHWRRGFAYGTLHGHPESGEELFLVQHHSDDQVTLTVKAFSRPSSRLARLGGPLTRTMQWRVTRRYLEAARVLGQEHSEGSKRPWILDRFDHRALALSEAVVGLFALALCLTSAANSGDTTTTAFTGVVACVGLCLSPYFYLLGRRLRSLPPG